MPTKAYEDFAPDPIEFTIRGKTYVVPEVGYLDGLRLQAIERGDESEKDTAAEEQIRLLMGGAFDQMKADNLPPRAINRAFLACLTDYRTGNRELAEQVWESGIDPKAIAAALAAKGSTSTGEASTTQKPASTTGTTSTPQAASAGTAEGSPSRKSADSGTSSSPTS